MTARPRLRTRLFIAYGAVLLVALAEIATAVFTTIDNARVGAEVVRASTVGIESAARLTELLGDVGSELFDRAVTGRYDARAVGRIERDVRGALARAREHALGDERTLASVDRLQGDFDALAEAYARTSPDAGLDPAVPALLARARAAALELMRRNLGALDASSRAAHERAAKVALLLGATTGIILLVGIWVSVRIARSMTDPLDRMAEGAGRYAAGEFAWRVPDSGVREIDALGARFNWMAEALERLRATDVERVVREQRRNETVLESIDDGLVILDAHGAVQRANPVALRQLGAEHDAVAGVALRELLPDAGLRTHIDAALAARGREVLAGEFELAVGDSPRRLGYSLVPFHDGTDPGVVLVMRDITEQRAFEALRTQFVLRASHELRTPLTGMRMAFDLLDRKLKVPTESREAELLATVRHELARLAQLISELVDLSRLYADSTELVPVETPVGELLAASAARLAAPAASARITLEIEDRCEGCLVRVDRAHLDRALDSLVDNALRASPPGATVLLRVERLGGEVRIEVADEGPGIPLGLRARIFEPFTQFGSQGGGHGLGLALSREVVARHGGRIDVESEPGRGARFWFTLPLA